jgi:hypothetical protein
MRDIIVKITNNVELEAVIPIDRVITIDENNIAYLSDTAFSINEDMIEKEL